VGLRFLPGYFEGSVSREYLAIELADELPDASLNDYLQNVDRTPLQTRKVDLILVVSPGFAARIARGESPPLYLLVRDDERSRLVYNRFTGVLNRWRTRLKEARLLGQGLPANFDEPFELRDPEKAKTDNKKASDELSKILAQILPFILVMWSLAGALYPAVDLCAGEKERGTMETLLISPASREEIVWGKFLTIWVFSSATGLLNLLSMGLTTWVFASSLGDLLVFQPSILFWGSILLLPLSAFFSALCLSVGVYARSSKEGQYYLMPLFLVTLPLIFLTLIPGVELNHFYSMVPVTGVALLLQSLIKPGGSSATLGMYIVPVLAPMIIYCWLALRWAIDQFQREEVLFREAERLDVGLWLRHLFREKDLLPSKGQALFCFLAVVLLHWVMMSALGRTKGWSLLVVDYLVLLTLPLFMALLLTKRPIQGLGLRLPPLWSWPAAAILAVILFLPGIELTYYLLNQFPGIRDSLRASQSQLRDGTNALGNAVAWSSLHGIVLILAGIQAVCEELTFRGFILSGLRRRFRPWTAIFLSAFLFAIFQMNVFQCLPHFALGVVMGILVWRCESVLPAILFHAIYNALVYEMLLISSSSPGTFQLLVDADGYLTSSALVLGVGSALLGVGMLFGISFWAKRRETQIEKELMSLDLRPAPSASAGVG